MRLLIGQKLPNHLVYDILWGEEVVDERRQYLCHGTRLARVSFTYPESGI